MSIATWQLGSHVRPRRSTWVRPREQLAAGVDDHAAIAGFEQGRVDHVGHRDRVVDGRPVPPVLARVKQA